MEHGGDDGEALGGVGGEQSRRGELFVDQGDLPGEVELQDGQSK